jgi:hypothetical protein
MFESLVLMVTFFPFDAQCIHIFAWPVLLSELTNFGEAVPIGKLPFLPVASAT